MHLSINLSIYYTTKYYVHVAFDATQAVVSVYLYYMYGISVKFRDYLYCVTTKW